MGLNVILKIQQIYAKKEVLKRANFETFVSFIHGQYIRRLLIAPNPSEQSRQSAKNCSPQTQSPLYPTHLARKLSGFTVRVGPRSHIQNILFSS
jgi:hypothetical protein